MLLRFDCAGGVIEVEKSSWIRIDWIDENTDIEKYISGDKILNNVTIAIKDSQVQFIALPAYYRGELFWAKNEKDFILCDDFFTIAKRIGTVSIMHEMMDFFLKKGYLPIGHTLFSEIRRIPSNCVVSLENEQFSKQKILLSMKSYEDDEQQYEDFKTVLNSVMDKYSIVPNKSILLSGGVDSRLLLLVLKERNDHMHIITSLNKPCFTENAYDVLTAEKIAHLVGEDIEVVEVAYDELMVSELDPIIQRMPFSVHTGMNFYHMCKVAKLDGVEAIFCGQNMDTLYNLGPTERTTLTFHGTAQWFKRFYLSEEYFRTLEDVEGRGGWNNKAIAAVGKKMFEKASHQRDLELPHTAAELINNFAHSNDYTVFGNGKGLRYADKGARLSPFEVKQKLYDIKLSYLKGGDSQAVEAGGYLNDLRIILPYSEQEMVNYLAGIHLTKVDTWKAKRYSYRYLKEFVPKYGKAIAQFNKPSFLELKERFGEVRDLYTVFEFVIKDTNFGRELSESGAIEAKGYTGLMKYESILRRYWFNRIITMLENEQGVVVQNKNQNG